MSGFQTSHPPLSNLFLAEVRKKLSEQHGVAPECILRDIDRSIDR